MSDYKIKDIKLSEWGRKEINIAETEMPGLIKLREEYDDLQKTIKGYKDLLDSKTKRMNLIKEELADIKEKYGDERRSRIEFSGGELSIEDMIPDEDMVITFSHEGYVKRTSLDEYRTQSRGGVGAKGVKTKDDDFNEHLFIASTHNYLLIFTEFGKVFWKKVWELPEGSKVSKGRAIQNLINIEQDDKVKAFICTQDLKDEDYVNSHYVIMATKMGQVKKTSR